MRQVTIFSPLLLVLLISVFGCTSDNAQVKNEGTARVKSGGTIARYVDRAPQSENGIPLLLIIPKYNVAQTKVAEERALLVHWDLQTGSISIEKKSSPNEKFVGDPRFKITADGGIDRTNEDGTMRAYIDIRRDIAPKSNDSDQGVLVVQTKRAKSKIEEFILKPPLPAKAYGYDPLLLSGTPDNFVLLVTYEDLSMRTTASGKLLLYDYSGLRERWREVKGACPSLVAAYLPDVIKVGDIIYIDDKSGFTVKAINLKKDQLRLVDYAPANKLIGQVKDTLNAPEIPPLQFGSHEDVMLIEVEGNSKSWIWAMRDDRCIGKIYVDSKDKKLIAYKEGKAVDEKCLPEAPEGIRLPRK